MEMLLDNITFKSWVTLFTAFPLFILIYGTSERYPYVINVIIYTIVRTILEIYIIEESTLLNTGALWLIVGSVIMFIATKLRKYFSGGISLRSRKFGTTSGEWFCILMGIIEFVIIVLIEKILLLI